jgi:hypothetical protein
MISTMDKGFSNIKMEMCMKESFLVAKEIG